MANKKGHPATLKPPKHGEPSRNPNGRPKGSRNRETIIRKWLEASEHAVNPITKEKEIMDQQDIMVLALIKRVRKNGDVAAFKELMDGLHGKIPDKQDITTKGEAIKQTIILSNGHEIELS